MQYRISGNTPQIKYNFKGQILNQSFEFIFEVSLILS